MKPLFKYITRTVLTLAFGAIFSSFSSLPGADKFEIYLNNKLVLNEYISHNTTRINYLSLQPRNYNHTVDVYYSHCGKTGTGRKLLLKDERNRVVKQFEFADVTGKRMRCEGKNIMSLLLKEDRHALKLFYASSELPEGRLLAYVVTSNSNYAKQ